jgi:hypothetical protein
MRESVLTVNQRQHIVNISWIPSVTLLMMLIIISTFQIQITSTFSRFENLKDFRYEVIIMYCIGALLEVVGEPWYNTFQCSGLYGPKLKADTIAIFVKCTVTFITGKFL